MSLDDLQQTLRELPRVGTLVKDRGYRQVWRFEHGGRAYFLKFYPRHGFRDAFRRLFRGSPAMSEFLRLQRLQKARVPAPRAIASLMGFRLNDQRGDAVIIEALEPSVPLGRYLADLQVSGREPPDRRRLALQLRQLIHQLGRAGLGHEDLHLNNILLHQNQLYLLDGYAIGRGGLRLRDVLHLGHSVARFATTSELLRGWDLLIGDRALPRRNPVARRIIRDFVRASTRDNAHFAQIAFDDGWRLTTYRTTQYPQRWSTASRWDISAEDWRRAWPLLLQQLRADQLEVIKRSPSGDVLGGEVVLGGRPLAVVVKRPRRKYLYRFVLQVFRGTRARAAWNKSWHVLLRNIPTAWPLVLAERRRFGYVVESLVIFERISGQTLAGVDLDALPAPQRQDLFRRAGRSLRRIDQHGFAHFDAKPANWVVQSDELRGPVPVLVDVDGVRFRRWTALGLQRLLRGMKSHPQYTPADSLELCRGYLPWARLYSEPPPGTPPATTVVDGNQTA